MNSMNGMNSMGGMNSMMMNGMNTTGGNMPNYNSFMFKEKTDDMDNNNFNGNLRGNK